MDKNAIYLAQIKELTFKNFKAVKDITFLKDDNTVYPWTIFLGNNGTGKTNLLRILSDLEAEDLDFHDIDGDYYIHCVPKCYSHFIFEYEYEYDIKSTLVYQEDYYEWNSTFSFNEGGFSSTRGQEDKIFKTFQVYAYGVSRRASRNTNLSSQNDTDNNTTLFNPDVTLINLNEWLLQTDYAVKNGQESAKRRLDLIKQVVTGDIFPEIQDFRFQTSENLNNYVEFKTDEGWFTFEDLAYGYQSTLSWIIDFCKKMFERYPTSSNPLKEPAVVVIDEIDLHLHPEWQRNITQILSNIFPKTQFIATTHSPLVVQSLEEANVYVLNKDKTSKTVSISRMPNKTFRGWSVEDILNKVMGLESKVKSDEYLSLIQDFDDGLDNLDADKSKQAYDKLMALLPDTDSQKRILQMQIKQFPEFR